MTKIYLCVLSGDRNLYSKGLNIYAENNQIANRGRELDKLYF
jgi:hypothetical protein